MSAEASAMTQPPTPQPPSPILQWDGAPVLQNNWDLARILTSKSAKSLTWCSRNKCEHYTVLRIRKRNGKDWRILHNPDSLLRVIQYKLLTAVFGGIEVPEYIHAFEMNRSIPKMAEIHVNKDVVISLDLRDFFHSIKQSQVNQLMVQLGVGAAPARLISELCTYKAFVPQGALTSPKVANLITATTFGPEVKEICDELGLNLSIYADDITISGNGEVDVGEVIRRVSAAVTRHSFRINHSKTKVMRKTTRQYVCGVVVNIKTNLIRKERYKLRAIVHNLVNHGLEETARRMGLEPKACVSHLRGKVNWFKQLNPELGGKLFDKLQAYLLEHPVTEEAPEPATRMGAVEV